jgi:hypothetical protein
MQQQRSGLVENGAGREEILLAGTANFDNLRRHSDGECQTYLVKHSRTVSVT